MLFSLWSNQFILLVMVKLMYKDAINNNKNKTKIYNNY